MLRIVDAERSDSQFLLPDLEARRVAETGDGKLAIPDKVGARQLQKGSSPLLGSLVEDLHVQPGVGGQVVSQVLTPGLEVELPGVFDLLRRNSRSRS